ncbi:MAG: acyl carrier protein [Mycobacterium sp.]|uniref:acyl carrier protein n=1 Tax=Mycobacterium sp. TaxID=1785 RepID=UPI003BB51F06
MNVEQSRPDPVSAALTEILRDDLNVDISRVTPESRLVDDVGLDSVAFAVGILAIEDKLGAAVSEQELLGCDTVGDLEQVIRAKVPVGQ